MVKIMEKDEIKKEIDRIETELKSIGYAHASYYESLKRTERLYPPDGGGHGAKWRAKIREKNERRAPLNYRLDELKARLAELEKDSEEICDYLAIGLFGDKLKLVSLLPDGTYNFLDEAKKHHYLFYLIDNEYLVLQKAVDEFERMINNPDLKEKHFQEFFEEYPQFILSDEHIKAHPRVVLEREHSGPLIPDFLLEPFETSYLCDLLEIKSPSVKTFVLKNNRERFSSLVMEAVAQLRRYVEYFDDQNTREKIAETYGYSCYKPKMFLIIGRKGQVSSIDIRRMHSSIPGVELKTYDDVLIQMKRKIEQFKKKIVLENP